MRSPVIRRGFGSLAAPWVHRDGAEKFFIPLVAFCAKNFIVRSV
jgi:hypothetical protein